MPPPVSRTPATPGRAPSRGGKLPRVLELVALLQGGPARTAAQLARELGVSARSIKRYVQDLLEAKVPVYHDREAGGYRVRRDYYLRPVDLTLSEAVALALLCEKVAGSRRIPNLGDATRALSKIESNLPAILRDELRGLASRMDVRTERAEYEGDSAAHYAEVQRAILRGTALQAWYEPARPGAVTEEFEFEPYALFFSVRAWYVVGRHSARRAVRTLKLVRFQRLKPLARRYRVPRGFSLERHTGNAWRMIRGDKDYSVELRFDPSFAQGVSETYWHPTQDFAFDHDGSLTMRFRVSGLDEIVWWVLSMGPHCRVIRPAALRSRVKALAHEVAAQYA